jgi:hypothetical protein
LNNLDINHFDKKMPQDETLTIRYLVICGKSTPDGFMKGFQYSEQPRHPSANHTSTTSPVRIPTLLGSSLLLSLSVITMRFCAVVPGDVYHAASLRKSSSILLYLFSLRTPKEQQQTLNQL